MCLEVGVNLEGVWSIFNVSEFGISYFSILEMTLISVASFRAPSEISGLPEVAILFLNPIHWKRLIAHEDFSSSINFGYSSLLF